jgi:hypothetical protein
VPTKSDHNVLVLVDSLDANRLMAASATIRAWSDAGNPAPLTLTTREWENSADIFAIEYADILERHRVLFGALNMNVRVDPSHLRLQLEHEAMGTLLQLRRAALAAGSDTKDQRALLEQSASTIMVVFRAVLRLRGERPPTDNIALVNAVASAAGLDASPFTRVIAHKRGEAPLRGDEVGPVLAGTLAGMQALVAYLDQFRKRA